MFLGKMKSNNKDGNSAKITWASVEKLQSGTESGVTFLATCLASVTSVDEWIVDPGASQHMTNN